MSFSLTEYLQTIDVSEPIEVGSMRVFGLRRDRPSDLHYLTLDEALEAKTIEVQELTESGVVGQLLVYNRGDDRVLIVAGEHLVGAKQNRVINASIMLDGRTKTVIDVSCVEAGRWSYRSKHFHAGPAMSYAKLRRDMSKQAYSGLRNSGRPVSDQHQVWREIDDKMRRMGSLSPSNAMSKMFEDCAEQLEDMERKVGIGADWSGVAVAIRGLIAGVDLFDQPSTLTKVWRKILRSYATDALESPAADSKTPREQIVEWLRSVAGARREFFPTIGVGQDLRILNDRLVGACLLVDDEPVHMALWAEDFR